MAWLALCHPLNNSRHAWSSAAGAADGSTASTRGSPKIWPIDGGVSRGSSLRNTSNHGSTCSVSGDVGRRDRERLLGAASRPTRPVRTAPFAVCTTTGTFDRERRAALRLAQNALDDVTGRAAHPRGALTAVTVTVSTGAPARPIQSLKNRLRSRPPDRLHRLLDVGERRALALEVAVEAAQAPCGTRRLRRTGAACETPSAPCRSRPPRSRRSRASGTRSAGSRARP